MNFGADYLIPKPFDPRLSGIVSAVAQAAMDSGVAKRPIEISRPIAKRWIMRCLNRRC